MGARGCPRGTGSDTSRLLTLAFQKGSIPRVNKANVCFSNRPVMGWTRRALASCTRKPAWGCENQEHPMPRATSSTNVIATIGIDIGKNTFHVIGLDDKGAIILRHKLSRG